MATKSQIAIGFLRQMFGQHDPGTAVDGVHLRTALVEKGGMQAWPAAILVGKLVKQGTLRVVMDPRDGRPGISWRRAYVWEGFKVKDPKPQDVSELDAYMSRAMEKPGKWTLLPSNVTPGQLQELNHSRFDVGSVIRWPVDAEGNSKS